MQLVVGALCVLGLIAIGGFYLMHARTQAHEVENGVVEFKKGNYAEAVRLLMPFAQQGEKTAELNMGIAYAFGYGVEKNQQTAVSFIGDSTGNKSSDMYLWIAKSYENGDGVVKDIKEASAWYHIAADAGNQEAKVWVDKNRI